MNTKIKTTERKAWHRATDRWEWLGRWRWCAGPRRPRFMRRNGQLVWHSAHRAKDHGDIFSHRTTEHQRRHSLRRIAP